MIKATALTIVFILTLATAAQAQQIPANTTVTITDKQGQVVSTFDLQATHWLIGRPAVDKINATFEANRRLEKSLKDCTKDVDDLTTPATAPTMSKWWYLAAGLATGSLATLACDRWCD